jgi:hypothetical protein
LRTTLSLSKAPTRRCAISPAEPAWDSVRYTATFQRRFDRLTAKAAELETWDLPHKALVAWLGECVAVAHNYSGVVSSMVAAIADTESALHASCVTVREAGTRLLTRAQDEGLARTDIDGTDLFALAGALMWLGDQASLSPRAAHYFDIIASAVLTDRARSDFGGHGNSPTKTR